MEDTVTTIRGTRTPGLARVVLTKHRYCTYSETVGLSTAPRSTTDPPARNHSTVKLLIDYCQLPLRLNLNTLVDCQYTSRDHHLADFVTELASFSFIFQQAASERKN